MSFPVRAFGTCQGHNRLPQPRQANQGGNKVVYTRPRLRNNVRQVPGSNQVRVTNNICEICRRTIR